MPRCVTLWLRLHLLSLLRRQQRAIRTSALAHIQIWREFPAPIQNSPKHHILSNAGIGPQQRGLLHAEGGVLYE